eukprot:12421668-Karenia_brevis.AAC.1
MVALKLITYCRLDMHVEMAVLKLITSGCQTLGRATHGCHLAALKLITCRQSTSCSELTEGWGLTIDAWCRLHAFVR